MKTHLKEQIDGLPRTFGVYTFKDKKGKVIYVGKAKSLRSRVRSYFRGGEALHPRTANLVKRIHDLDFIATRSEVEALILECNLIKHFKPRYNVNLKDDKKYPYIKVTSREPFPTVYPTRNLKHDGSRYFGPYTDARAMRKSLKFLTDTFCIRTCKRKLPLRTPDRGCLNYHIGKCVGPCRGDVSEEAYKALIHQVCQYLSGRMTDLIRDVNALMEKESTRLRFEEAARLRDTLQALEKVREKQIVVSPSSKDRDIIAVRADGGKAVGLVLKVREGKLVGKEVFNLAFEGEVSQSEILQSFLEQYLTATTFVPDEILIEEIPEGIPLIRTWLREKTGRNIKVQSPRGGKGGDLIRMAGENASLVLTQVAAREKQEPRIPASITELARWLDLPALPVRIAAFDISNIQGAQPVGSRVFFKNGRPLKRLYRRYSIEPVGKQDDFAMMREVLRRAWSHVESGEEEAPDLLLIDGGRGQVSSALKGVADAAGGEAVPPVIGIAKRLDEIHVPGRRDTVQIPHDSPALRLLQRIRDEAHRFAIDYHRKKRRRESLRSRLEGIDGIGRVLSQRLLAEFGSVGRIKDAGAAELVRVRGMSKAKAERVVESLRDVDSEAGEEPNEAGEA
jgi:excinuclease ABC subunit C